MKSRLLFSIIVLCVIALIITAAKLTTTFFDLSSIPEEIAKKPKTQKELPEKPKEEQPKAVFKTVIDISDAVSRPEAKQSKLVPPPSPSPAPAADVPVKPVEKEPIIPEKKIEEKKPEPKPELKKPERPGIGTVMIASGNVSAIRGKMDFRELKVNARVFLNEKIETGAGSRIEIKFDDNSTISQGENSSIVIDEFVYQPDQKDKNGFGMRIIKGMCRVVTGMITEINPKRFNVKTRMATIGIRGCELAFRSKGDRDDIYVIGLSGERTVEVKASKSGKNITNIHTGKPIPEGRKDMITYTLSKPQQRISVLSGDGVEQAAMSPKDIREMVEESTRMGPAEYQIQNSRSGAIFILKPPKLNDSDN